MMGLALPVMLFTLFGVDFGVVSVIASVVDICGVTDVDVCSVIVVATGVGDVGCVVVVFLVV